MSAFKRDFVKIFNTTPSHWLVQTRLEKAYYLIARKNKRQSDIYREVGFEDLSNFSFAFKKLFGYSLPNPPKQKRSAANMVTIKTFDNYFTANIILTKLHAAGMECYLKDEYTVTIDPIISNAIGGIKLVVKEEDEAASVQLLQKYEEEYMKSATCPRCGNSSFAYITKPGASNYLTAIFTWLFSNYAVAPDYIYQCQKCGYESESFPETYIQEPSNQN